MIFSDTFLDELRLVVKDCLLKGNLEKVTLVKQLLEYDNSQFGDFLAPLLSPQDNSLHHLVSYSSSDSNLVKLSKDEHNSAFLEVSPSTIDLEHGEFEEVQEPTYKWKRKYISPEAKGNLCGIVILTETGCSIEDVESGKVLYEGNYKVVTHFNFYHGAVISFNRIGVRLLNVYFEDYIDLEDGVEIVKNCPIEKDDEGYYVPSNSEGRSLTEFGSICSPFNLIPKVVESYKIATAVSVDLFIRPGSIPRVVWVHQPDDISVNSISNSSIKPVDKFIKQVEEKSVRVFSKLDFDLKGLKVAVVGLPKSQTERFRTMVVIEKEVEELVFIDSSSHEDQVHIPSKLKDFDIVLVVKRFVGHGTIYALKSLLEGSSAALVNSTSHGLDALEKALYRGKEGYPSEEGTVQVPYPYK
jgi:hypothetical protein